LLIEHGASRSVLLLFGVLCVSSGLLLWHGESRHFFSSTPMRDFADSNEE
jgi:hypothetical protein